jgi:hypothetical protein
MAVYVDALFKTQIADQWPYSQACHMVATSNKELLLMAEKLNLDVEDIKSMDSINLFYLNIHKRRKAIRKGAREITTQQLFERKKEWKS